MFSALVVKVAFVYCVDAQKTAFANRVVEPTFRVSLQVYPKLRWSSISLAASEVKDDGTVTPLVRGKLDLKKW